MYLYTKTPLYRCFGPVASATVSFHHGNFVPGTILSAEKYLSFCMKEPQVVPHYSFWFPKVPGLGLVLSNGTETIGAEFEVLNLTD